jgi:hypothetical protein
LYVAVRDGRYLKQPGEDLASIVDGIIGFKGRVHLSLAPPLTGDFADAEAMAERLDHTVVGGMRIFPTHVTAARSLGLTCPDSPHKPIARVTRAFEGRLAGCPEAERPYLLGGYGNLINNRRALGLG